MMLMSIKTARAAPIPFSLVKTISEVAKASIATATYLRLVKRFNSQSSGDLQRSVSPGVRCSRCARAAAGAHYAASIARLQTIVFFLVLSGIYIT